MANFGLIIQWLLYQEDDKRIPGKIANLGDGAGFTRLGITSKNFAAIMPIGFWNETNFSFAQAVPAAKSFYKAKFWDYIGGDQINDDEVAAVLLSASVNLGTHEGVQLMQGLLGIEPDGVVGPQTIAVINQKDPAKMYRASWAGHYHSIVDANPSKQQFLDGWLNRANFPYPSPLVGNLYA